MDGMSETATQGDAESLAPHTGEGHARNSRFRRGTTNGAHHTRISGAWTAVAVAALLGIALIDFIVQNTRSVRVEFFGASGKISVAVAMLAAALAGAFVVLAVGVSRRAAGTNGPEQIQTSRPMSHDCPRRHRQVLLHSARAGCSPREWSPWHHIS